MDNKLIDEFREKMDSIMEGFKAEDFERVHSKFFGGLIALEVGFKRRFPERAEKYFAELYDEPEPIKNDLPIGEARDSRIEQLEEQISLVIADMNALKKALLSVSLQRTRTPIYSPDVERDLDENYTRTEEEGEQRTQEKKG